MRFSTNKAGLQLRTCWMEPLSARCEDKFSFAIFLSIHLQMKFYGAANEALGKTLEFEIQTEKP